jgi:hypothetical protein
MDANRAVRSPAALVNPFTSIEDSLAGTGAFRNPGRERTLRHQGASPL